MGLKENIFVQTLSKVSFEENAFLVKPFHPLFFKFNELYFFFQVKYCTCLLYRVLGDTLQHITITRVQVSVIRMFLIACEI